MLKLLAVLSMTVDHAAVIFVPVLESLRTPYSIAGEVITLYWIMRKIGRLAFPIFCFLIAEGYLHTRSKLRYALRLLLFAAISEMPFNLMVHNRIFYLGAQNVYFTLFLGLLMIYAFDSLGSDWKKLLAMAAICIAAAFLQADYGLIGVLLVFLLYLLRSYPVARAFLAYPLLSGGIAAWVAFVPISLYNGKRGFIHTPAAKVLFYLYYPLHILVLFGIRCLIA